MPIIQEDPMPRTERPIEFGLSSKAMAAGAAVSTLIGVYHAVKEGDHTEETLGAGFAAVAFLWKLADGRYKQATADRLADRDDMAGEPLEQKVDETRDLHEGGLT
jgi:hypothetical protein